MRHLFSSFQSILSRTNDVLFEENASSLTSNFSSTMFFFGLSIKRFFPLKTSIRWMNNSSAFPFLPTNKLPSKPDRKKGLTQIRGPYYAPVTQTYLNELLADWGEFVDGIKFAGGAFSLMPEKRLRDFIDIAHRHQCYVSTGGFIERVLASSAGDKQMIKKYLHTCKKLG